VGIISFSRSIQFYSIREGRPEPFGICSVNSLDPFCPLPSELWIKPVRSHMDILKSLLWRLPELHPHTIDGEGGEHSYGSSFEGAEFADMPSSCPTATLLAAADGLKDIGGKISLFSANHSVSGVGCLANNREYSSGSACGTPAELALYGSLNAAAALTKGGASTSYSGYGSGYSSSGGIINNASSGIDTSGAAFITGDIASAVVFGREEDPDTSPMSCFPDKGRGDDKATLEGYLLFADWCGKQNISSDVYIPMDGNRYKDLGLFAELTRKDMLCCGVLWCAVVWCGVLCCGVVWCAVVWCGVVWCGVVWCAMLCYAMLCYAMLCCGVLCCGVVCCGVLWCAMLCCAMLCCAMLCCAVVCCAVVWCAMLYYAMLCCAMLCYAMLCCAMLCCAMVCCAMLCYAVLWCGVVWCGVVCCGVVWCAMLCYAMLYIVSYI
jgi:hypothetical protein